MMQKKTGKATAGGAVPRILKKIGVGAVAVLTGWLVGGALHVMTNTPGAGERVELPDDLLDEIAATLPESRYYLLFDQGSCGTPFQTTVNYLHNRRLDDLIVVTSDKSLRKLRGVGRSGGVDVIGGYDALVSRVTAHADAVLLERLPGGKFIAYPFVRPNRSEFIAVLDDVLGVSTQRDGALRLSSTQPVEAVVL